MKAIVQTGYGKPEVLVYKDLPIPEIKDNQVLVKIKASSVNSGDAFTMMGNPWMVRLMIGFKPKDHILGWDYSGVIEKVGSAVTSFKVGDEVYGGCSGGFAEYAAVPARAVGLKPASLSFAEAATLPTAALTALQELRDMGGIKAGMKVLINGASGGVGIFAVQIAKIFGAEVTGVCSGRNVEMVKALGADHVIDYTQEDFTKGELKYDLILDNVASRSFADLRKALAPDGLVLPNSGHGGMSYVIKSYIYPVFTKRISGMHLTILNTKDLDIISGWFEEGKLRTVIDRTYPLSETPQAVGYVSQGHARGKVSVLVE